MKDVVALEVANKKITEAVSKTTPSPSAVWEATTYHYDIIRHAFMAGDPFSAREALFEAVQAAIRAENKRCCE